MTTTFTYNGDRHRLAKTENGETTTYAVAVLGLSQVLVETTGGESVVYLYGHDLLAEEGSSGWAYHLGDGLGSVRQLAAADGDVDLAQGYTPFGVPLWDAGNTTTGYGFTGERWEAEAGLLFLRARYYEPRTGRFITKDPWPGDTEEPATLQQWTYVYNDPVNKVDWAGLYGYDVTHYARTRRWAWQEASVYGPMLDTRRVAESIAQGDRRTDTNMRLSSVGACNVCHFCDKARTDRHIRDALGSCNPHFFGMILHQLQDYYTHRGELYRRSHAQHNVGQRGARRLWYFFHQHSRDQVRVNVASRNPNLHNVNGLSDNDLIDLYLRYDPGRPPDWLDLRDAVGFNTDEYIQGSRRDTKMQLETRVYLRLFMLHLTVDCCEIDWNENVVQQAEELLRE